MNGGAGASRKDIPAHRTEAHLHESASFGRSGSSAHQRDCDNPGTSRQQGVSGVPPVSGSVSADAEGLALFVALVLEAELAEAEALLIALAVAETLVVGLAATSSSIPRSSIPLSSKPSAPRASIPLSVWAATGAKTNTADATENASETDLRIFSPFILDRDRQMMPNTLADGFVGFLCAIVDTERGKGSSESPWTEGALRTYEGSRSLTGRGAIGRPSPRE
jgi:hypothetical protein